MKTVDPRKGRATVMAGAGGLEITIPARKRLYHMVFYGPFVLFWAFMGGIIPLTISEVVNEPEPLKPLLFLFIWSLAWLFVGSLPLFTLAWMFWGREIVVLDGDGMIHRRRLFGLGTDRRYDLAHMSRLRVVREVTPGWGIRSGPFSAAGQMIGVSGGSLAFDYGMKTPDFGAALDDAEAEYLRHEICERLPALCAGGSGWA